MIDRPADPRRKVRIGLGPYLRPDDHAGCGQSWLVEREVRKLAQATGYRLSDVSPSDYHLAAAHPPHRTRLGRLWAVGQRLTTKNDVNQRKRYPQVSAAFETLRSALLGLPEHLVIRTTSRSGTRPREGR